MCNRLNEAITSLQAELAKTELLIAKLEAMVDNPSQLLQM